MNIQYIGARYVPKFFEGSAGSTWLPGLEYEPLTIVKYLGSSWTSKKPVPATVGAPNLNPEYWINTGNMNEQINALTNQINQLRTDLTDEINSVADNLSDVETELNQADSNLSTRITDNTNDIVDISSSGVFAGNIIIIGDSYAEGWTPDGTVTSWATIVKNNSGCQNAIIKYQGGCGFGRENNGKTFYTLLQEAYAEIPEADRNTYTAVIIGGGYNDNGIDTATVRTGIHNCANFVKNNLPAARFIVAFLGWSREPDTLSVPSRRYTMARYALALTGIKVQYIGDAYKALAFREAGRMSSDGRHPSQAGQDALAAHIITVINGGNVEYNSEANQELGANINCYLTDEDFCVNVFGSKFLIPDTINQNAFNGSSINGVCNFNLPFTPPASSVPYNGCSMPGILNYKDASNNSIYRPCTVTLRINAAGGFNVYVACINDAGTGWLSNANTLVSVFIPIGVYRWKIIDL